MVGTTSASSTSREILTPVNSCRGRRSGAAAGGRIIFAEGQAAADGRQRVYADTEAAKLKRGSKLRRLSARLRVCWCRPLLHLQQLPSASIGLRK